MVTEGWLCLRIKFEYLVKWTKDNIPRQDDKTVIITGANSGIGFQMAGILASKGARVIMACRNSDKAGKAAEKIYSEYHDAKLELMQLDLSSLKSIREFAVDFKKKSGKLDVLINNAGVMATPYRKTGDGFEWQFGINHLGHFALTGLLLDMLAKTERSRVVMVTSIAHFNGKIHFDDLSGRSWYRKMTAYRQSKLADLLFAYELQKRLSANDLPVMSVAAHPGISSTNIVRLPFPLTLLKDLVLMSASKGALPVLMAATGTEIKGGEYIGPSCLWQTCGSPAVLRSSDHSYNRDLWAELWRVSEEMTGVYYLDGLSD